MTLLRQKCGAARALLGMSTAELAERARVRVVIVKGFETGRGPISQEQLVAIEVALTTVGIILQPAGPDIGPGVRPANPLI